MTDSFSLAGRLALADLRRYVALAARVDDGAVRLIGDSGVLAVYTAVFAPRGLLDRSATVLGLRTFATDPGLRLDAVVPLRSLRERLDRREAAAGDGPVEVGVPLGVSSVMWAGISPPRTGWHRVATTDGATLDAAARAGIAEVAEALPGDAGERVVRRVRAEVWGRPLDGLVDVPTGAAFAASHLGFLADDDPVAVYEAGPWSRLTARGGHVLVRRPDWRLKA